MKGTTMTTPTPKANGFSSLMASNAPAAKSKKPEPVHPNALGGNQIQTVKAEMLGIVALMEERRVIAEEINERIEKLQKENGLEKKVTRATASIMFKNNKEDADEHTAKVNALYNKIA
jgi:hypothetical protein